MTRVRLALVGYGKWGRNYVKAAADSGEAEVTRVVTSRPPHQEDAEVQRLMPKSARHYFGGLGLEQAIEECDAVVFAAHPAGAARTCDASLTRNKPILCEKPAGLSLADAERIAAAEAASKAFVLVGHQHLFAEGYEALRDLGRPAYVESFFFGPTVRDYSVTWDYGAHAVACLLGLDADPRTHGSSWWHVGSQASKMARVVTGDDPRPGYSKTRVIYDAYESNAEPPLTRQVRAFARAVRNGGTDDYRFGAKWAVDVARVLEAAEKSNR